MGYKMTAIPELPDALKEYVKRDFGKELAVHQMQLIQRIQAAAVELQKPEPNLVSLLEPLAQSAAALLEIRFQAIEGSVGMAHHNNQLQVIRLTQLLEMFTGLSTQVRDMRERIKFLEAEVAHGKVMQ